MIQERTNVLFLLGVFKTEPNQIKSIKSIQKTENQTKID